MIRTRLLSLIAAACVTLPITAFAQQQAFTSKSVNLRAGPAREYPLVAQLPPGVSVTVAGCINGYTWCDVYLPGGNRGWIYAQNLNYPYQGNQVPLMTYGSTIGLPIVAFTIGAYWGQYYRGRPWFHNQSQWSHIRPGMGGHRPGVRPPGPGVRPPIGVRPPPGGGHVRPPGGGHVRPPGGGNHRPPGGGHVRPPGGGKPGGGRPPGGPRPQPR